MTNFKSKYLEDTDTLDQAKSSLPSRPRAKAKQQSNLDQPLVLEKEDPQFKANWSTAVADTERNLCQVLQGHLAKVVNNSNIRTTAKQSLRKLRLIQGGKEAKQTLEKTIQEAEKECKAGILDIEIIGSNSRLFVAKNNKRTLTLALNNFMIL